MANLITGNLFKLLYSDDPANNLPVGAGVYEITNLAAMPTLQLNSTQVNYETYDSTYTTVLLSNKNISPFEIIVNYVPDEASTVYLDNKQDTRDLFQVILNYRQTDGTIDYAAVAGYITAGSVTGSKDEVVRKTYTFTPQDLVVSLRTIDSLEPLYEGSYGVGSNGTDVPQYQPVTPEGNSFIKVPSSQTGNPAGADMMGIGLVDGTSVAEFAMTKSGTLSLYAKNATTAWTRILTATQIQSQYVPINRTVNGKALTTNITLDKSDVGLGNVTNDAQLTIANNLSDLESVDTARANLNVYSKTTVDTKVAAVQTSADSKLAKASNLSDLTDKAVARTNLGLGTSAVVNTGTSGNTIPLLSGTNAWSNPQAFNASSMSIGGTTKSTGVGLELGSTVAAGTSYIDFHSSGTTSDYDARISTSGGTATTLGKMTITASSLATQSLELTNDLAIAHGGTGASTFDQALINLNAMKFQRTSLGNSDNLNSFDGSNPGFFYCATNAAATAANNYPVTQAGSLMVIRNGANGVVGCTQMYFPYNSNDIYVRTCYAGSTVSWSGWNLVLQQGSFGVGAITTTTPPDATNRFIADAYGATTWAPANGAGFQASYANNRLFQYIQTTGNKAYIRYNDSGDARVSKTTKPWTELLTPGSYGLGADLTVNSSTPIASLGELTPTGFYYTSNENTLGGVTSDTTYVLTNRGGRPTAHAAKYVQQRSWNGYYMGSLGWTWREQAQLESNQTFTGSNTFNGKTNVNGDITFTGYIDNTASNPMAIRSTNPTLSFVESDSSNSAYMFVADGGNFRLNRDNTGGVALYNYTRSSNTLSFAGVNALFGSATAQSVTSGGLTISNSGYASMSVMTTAPGDNVVGSRNVFEVTSNGGTFYLVRRNNVNSTGQYVVNFPTSGGTLALTATSDANYKRDIKNVDGYESLENIRKINPVTFIYTDDEQNRKRRGVIAQELELIDPNYVKHTQEITDEVDDDGEPISRERLIIDNNPLLMDTVIATKLLAQENETLKAQIDELKTLVQQLLNQDK